MAKGSNVIDWQDEGNNRRLLVAVFAASEDGKVRFHVQIPPSTAGNQFLCRDEAYNAQDNESATLTKWISQTINVLLSSSVKARHRVQSIIK